jgi:hypothetical protein
MKTVHVHDSVLFSVMYKLLLNKQFEHQAWSSGFDSNYKSHRLQNLDNDLL